MHIYREIYIYRFIDLYIYIYIHRPKYPPRLCERESL